MVFGKVRVSNTIIFKLNIKFRSILVNHDFEGRHIFLLLLIEMFKMKRFFWISVVLIMMSATSFAQPDRIGIGLSFSELIRFNKGDTGNPGINIKTWVPLDRRRTMFIVPSLTVYNPHAEKPNSSYYTTTYLLHGDLDFQYRIYNERTLTVIGFAGVNYTHIISKIELLISMLDPPTEDATFGIGPNIGAGLEMRMSSFWDFNVNAKYAFPGIAFNDPASVPLTDPITKPKFIYSPLSALVIEVQAVYYFSGRGKGYGR